MNELCNYFMKIVNISTVGLGGRANSINRLAAAGEQTSAKGDSPTSPPLHISRRKRRLHPLILLLHPLSRLYLFLCDCSCDIHTWTKWCYM